MSFKKTLIFSAVLHSCFLAAFPLLPARVPDTVSRQSAEKVFFVKLASGIVSENSGVARPAAAYRQDTVKSDRSAVIRQGRPWKARPHKSPPVTAASWNFISWPRSVYDKDALSGKGASDLNRQTDTAPISSSGRTAVSGSGDGLNAGIIDLIRESIEREKTYPVLARKKGIEGTVYIGFRIDPEGRPQDIKILESSGSSILDSATLDIVKNAAPFPYVDATVEVPVVYRLNR